MFKSKKRPIRASALARMSALPIDPYVTPLKEPGPLWIKTLYRWQSFTARLTASHPTPANARTHSKRQVRQIVDSIKAFGFLNPLLIDDDSMVLAGHGRLQAAKLIGMAEVPTVLADGLTMAQKRALMLADNKIAENAGWDRSLLALELGDLALLLPEMELDLTLTGFDAGEIDQILIDHSPAKADPGDQIPAVVAQAVCRPGDLWRMGEHRLLCGDARSTEDLDRLMGGQQARLMFTDPPYNVPIAGHVQGRGRIRHADIRLCLG